MRLPDTTRTETVVVGAGQAGLALSHWLTRAGREHVVLERGHIGQSWRDRWESLTLLTPNSANRLPGDPPPADPDGFLSRDEFVQHLCGYVATHSLPVREGVTVHRAHRRSDGTFEISTDDGTWTADNLVVASGFANAPRVPPVTDQMPPVVQQLHSSEYHRPDAVERGPVLVVGAGASGQQIAAELARAGRPVTIAVGSHRRLPRRYRGRDIWDWMELLGELGRTVDTVSDIGAARRTPSAALSGRCGGEWLDLAVLADLGVTLRGRMIGAGPTGVCFDSSLPASVRHADLQMRATLERVDGYITDRSLDAPPADPIADVLPDDEGSQPLPFPAAVVWATGYRSAHPWLDVAVRAPDGVIEQRRGVTSVAGLYVLGIRFQHQRRSHFIGGVGDDARYIAARITGCGG